MTFDLDTELRAVIAGAHDYSSLEACNNIHNEFQSRHATNARRMNMLQAYFIVHGKGEVFKHLVAMADENRPAITSAELATL